MQRRLNLYFQHYLTNSHHQQPDHQHRESLAQFNAQRERLAKSTERQVIVDIPTGP